jgi:adenosylmethionine---8-amino-7-oxononanoate aminotransferase
VLGLNATIDVMTGNISAGRDAPAEKAPRTAQTADLIARDAACLWHPFTQQSLWIEDDPLVVDRAEGMYFWDTDGNRYLDGVSSLWVNVHGHRAPEIDDAIRRQLDRLDHTTFLGLTHEPGIELAEKLLATAPEGLSRVFYAGDGASAVEAAIKMAYQAQAQRGHTRPYFAHVAEGYHGDTLGAVSVGGIDLFHSTYRPILLETRTISSPGILAEHQTRAERAAIVLAELAELLERDGDRISAVVIEPMVQAAGGMLTHDTSFVVGVRALCDTYGTLLVCDEVATGIGRTGKMWAVDHAGVTPDLLTCGKGLTGGYLPLSAVLTTEAVYDAFLGSPDSARTFFHGHSYTANPLCCAAAIASLDLMAQRNTVAHATKIGELMGASLAPLNELSGVKEVRRIGTMTGIEVESVGPRTGFQICQEARRHGVWVRPLGDVVVLMPPLAIGVPEAVLLTDVVSDAIRKVIG